MAVIKREDMFDVLAVREVHQGGISKIKPEIMVLFADEANWFKIGRFKGK